MTSPEQKPEPTTTNYNEMYGTKGAVDVDADEVTIEKPDAAEAAPHAEHQALYAELAKLGITREDFDNLNRVAEAVERTNASGSRDTQLYTDSMEYTRIDIALSKLRLKLKAINSDPYLSYQARLKRVAEIQTLITGKKHYHYASGYALATNHVLQGSAILLSELHLTHAKFNMSPIRGMFAGAVAGLLRPLNPLSGVEAVTIARDNSEDDRDKRI